MPYPSALLAKYKVGKTIGKGGFGKIKLVTRLGTKHIRALKIMRKRAQEGTWQRELDILPLLKHPNVVKYFCHFESKTRIFIVFEFCAGGDLFQMIADKDCLSEIEAKPIVAQLLSALEYCHGNLLAHRDIKPENVLLDTEGRIRLADFGFAKMISTTGMTGTSLGSLDYTAVEVYSYQPYDPFLSDVWSLGMTIAVMVLGFLPFEESNSEQLTASFQLGVVPELMLDFDKHKRPTSPEFRDLIRLLLNPSPDQRLKLDRVKRHPWLRGYHVDSRLPEREPVLEAGIDKGLVDIVANLTHCSRDELKAILTEPRRDCLGFSIYHLLLERQEEQLRPHLKVEDRTLSGTELTRSAVVDPDTPPVLRMRRRAKKIRITSIV